MRFLFQLYVNALIDGKPFVVLPTLVVAVALGVGTFIEGIPKRDPAAIGLLIFVLVLVSIFLTIVIIDGRNKRKSKKGQRKR